VVEGVEPRATLVDSLAAGLRNNGPLGLRVK